MNLNIDLDGLKTKTEQAITKGKDEAARTAQEKAAEVAAANAKMRAEAEEVIAKIPGLCEKAAEKGKRRAVIMEEKRYGNFKSEFAKGNWTAQITGGPGSIVIEACQKAGLKVDVQYAHDGCGMESWAEIAVSWD